MSKNPTSRRKNLFQKFCWEYSEFDMQTITPVLKLQTSLYSFSCSLSCLIFFCLFRFFFAFATCATRTFYLFPNLCAIVTRFLQQSNIACACDFRNYSFPNLVCLGFVCGCCSLGRRGWKCVTQSQNSYKSTVYKRIWCA